ncbi:hypothetical protein FA95DRAFT_1310053 [Auriscalpium vulgare]|uniref:Uncharacterized protein n=1 Tax=Auriscalpium vulgare TaxID=40419 RepID=A0ACB8RT67_9AGAM|nr:hypothetical protein FA95DRAFT_1310053 [Auriscalpium vulgare]
MRRRTTRLGVFPPLRRVASRPHMTSQPRSASLRRNPAIDALIAQLTTSQAQARFPDDPGPSSSPTPARPHHSSRMSAHAGCEKRPPRVAQRSMVSRRRWRPTRSSSVI